MTRITCACFDCKHCNQNAECTAEEIKLTQGSIATVWEGRQDVWWCKSFEISEEAKESYERIREIFKGATEETNQKHFTPEDVRRMSREEVRKNYKAIMDSMKEWK